MKKQVLDGIENYPIQFDLPVVWGDMDAMQHVNNVAYFRYLETARVSFFEQAGLMAYAKNNQIGLFVSEQFCKYIRPVTYPDVLTVGVNMADIQEVSFELKYLIHSKQQNCVAAIGSSKMVCWSIKDQKKAVLPDSIMDQVEKMLNQ